MKSCTGATTPGIGGFFKKLPIFLLALVILADIVFGFFWVKGFYYTGKIIAWLCIASIVLVLLEKLVKLKFWGRLKRAFSDDDDNSTTAVSAPAPKATATATTSSAPATTPMTKEEYEKASNELMKKFEKALKDGDTALENTIREEMQELKKRAPKAPSAEDVKKKLEEAKKLLDV